MITRVAALFLALLLTAGIGAGGVDRLLVVSQVALSLTLPFVLGPLLYFVNDRLLMRALPASRAIICALGMLVVGLTCLNLWLASTTFI